MTVRILSTGYRAHLTPQTAQFFKLLLFLPLLCTPSTTKSLITIPASTAPDSAGSLEHYLCGEGGRGLVSGTTLVLSQGRHTLRGGPFCLLENLENITVQGEEDSSATIYCDSSDETRRGVTFHNITNLLIIDVTITNCGAEIPDSVSGVVNETFAFLGPRQRGVLIVTHCANLILESVTVNDYYGFAILVIAPLGEAVVQNMSIRNGNRHSSTDCAVPTQRPDMYCAGSGVIFLYADTNTTNATMEDMDTTLNIVSSSFINNTNILPVNRQIELVSILAVGFETRPILLSGTAGLAVYFSQRDFFVDVKIINTTTVSCLGNVGAMLVVHYNTVRTSRVFLDRSVFADNNIGGESVNLNRGGGLFILIALFVDALHTFPSAGNDIYDIMEISRSNFSRNSAYYGGGIMFYVTPQNVSAVRLVLRESVFVENAARFGSALNFFQFQSAFNSRAVSIYMEDIVATNNTYFNSSLSGTPPEESAVFYIGHSRNVTVVGTDSSGSYFHDNAVSVFGTVGTNIILDGNISFIGNRGFSGGALNLLDTSILYINNRSLLQFVQNTAFTRGGAIFSNTLGTAVTETCAIQIFADDHISLSIEELKLLNIQVLFSNNSARVSGNSVFANPLYDCFFLPISPIDHVELYIQQGRFIYEETLKLVDSVDNGLAEIASVEEELCVCKSRTFLGDDCYTSDNHQLDQEVIPGQAFVVFLNPIDDAGTPVASLLYSELSIDSSAMVELHPSQYIRSLPGRSECSEVEFNIFAPENSRLHLNLFAMPGGQKTTIEVNITSCPPGFTLASRDGRQQCVCSDFVENTLDSTCNLTSYTVARPENYWLGTKTENGSHILQFISTCPIDYCRNDITDVDLRVPDQICVTGRTGTLCGACDDNLSSIFGPADCRDCSNAWLATLILYAVVGILLVCVQFLLDITITHGTITGMFFYVNIVRVNANIYFKGGRDNILFWYISWLNLEVGFPLCFYDGMSELAKLGLQYVFPAYIILILLGIVFLSQRSLVMQRILLQLDGTHALVSIFYISFLKLLRTVIDTGTFVTIVTENNNRHMSVWLFDGTHQISSPTNISLLILGILAICTFILPYVFVITFSTYVQRVANSPRLNAYFDASLAPYKDNHRYWFGARLILTCILYMLIADRGTNNPTLTLTLQLSFLVGFAILQAFIQPFKKLGIAILDMSFFVNLILLMIGTSYTAQNESRNHDQNILINFSISISVLTGFGIMVYHLSRRLSKFDIVRRKTEQFWEKLMYFYSGLKRNTKHIASREEDNKTEEEGKGEAALQGVKYMNVRKPSTPTSSHISLRDMTPAPDDMAAGVQEQQHLSSSQLREPVLDFLSVPDDRHTT